MACRKDLMSRPNPSHISSQMKLEHRRILRFSVVEFFCELCSCSSDLYSVRCLRHVLHEWITRNFRNRYNQFDWH